jgi:hypothetical protein
MEQSPRYRPEYLQAFGLLEIEWNRLEGVLFDLFYQLCGARFDKRTQSSSLFRCTVLVEKWSKRLRYMRSLTSQPYENNSAHL